MAESYNILIAGFGGQGILFTGKVMAYAGLIGDREVSWLPSYGPESRGGTSTCSVCISGEAIASPLVTRPDVLITLNAPSYDKYIGGAVPGGMAFINSSLIPEDPDERGDIKVFRVPVTELSNEHGLEGIANIIMLGKVLKETGFADYETVEKAIKACVPARNMHLLEHNIRAVKLGMGL